MENLLAEVQTRGCVTLESWLFGLRMQFWPVFQKLMTEHVSSLSKLAEAGTGGLFRRAAAPSDELIRIVRVLSPYYRTEIDITFLFRSLTDIFQSSGRLSHSQKQRMKQ